MKKSTLLIVMLLISCPFTTYASADLVNSRELSQIKKIGLYLNTAENTSNGYMVYKILTAFNVKDPVSFVGAFVQNLQATNANALKLREVAGYGPLTNLLIVYLNQVTKTNSKKYTGNPTADKKNLVELAFGMHYPADFDSIFNVPFEDFKAQTQKQERFVNSFKFYGEKGSVALDFYFLVWQAQAPPLTIPQNDLKGIKAINFYLAAEQASYGYWVLHILRHFNIADPVLLVKLFSQNYKAFLSESFYSAFFQTLQTILRTDGAKKREIINRFFGGDKITLPQNFNNIFYAPISDLNTVYDKMVDDVNRYVFESYRGDEALNRILPPLISAL